MNLVNRSRRLAAVAAAVAMLAAAQPAAAQEVANTHLAAARAAISAMNATDEFDLILPQAAQALKAELIQKDPHLQALIIEIVDSTAISLAARRGDLEREAALVYARAFSEQELQDIAAFYASEAGQKVLRSGPAVAREIYQAAEIWQNGVARDLAQQVAAELTSRAPSATVNEESGEEGEEGPAEEGSAEE